MAATEQIAIPVIGIDIAKNSLHVVGFDNRGATVLRRKWSRGQVETRKALEHDARLMNAWPAASTRLDIPWRSRPQHQNRTNV